MSQQRVLPPKRFRPAGVVDWVEYSPTPPPFIRQQRRTGKRAEGIRYEGKIHLLFEERLGSIYIASPWFRFLEVGNDKPRWCQPDALIIDFARGQITIVECKLQHTADAWWQLKWLYLPVIAKAFPGTHWKYGLVEVVKWYDCATAFPEEVKMCANILHIRPGEFGVHICKP